MALAVMILVMMVVGLIVWAPLRGRELIEYQEHVLSYQSNEEVEEEYTPPMPAWSAGDAVSDGMNVSQGQTIMGRVLRWRTAFRNVEEKKEVLADEEELWEEC